MSATEIVELDGPIALDCGAELDRVRIAYESYGDPSAPVVLVCHALSGDAHAAGLVEGLLGAGETAVGGLGWWDAMIGPERGLDTDRYRVVCTNLIGGCRGSTGPSSIDEKRGRPYGSRFPELSVRDLVRAQRAFLKVIDVEALECVVGASLGGMQALQFALDFPAQVRSVIAIASTRGLSAQGVALNAIARAAITADPAWQGGDYYDTGRLPDVGLALAREIGHVTYLSKEALAAKSPDDRLGVERYLTHQAAKFVARFDANSYLCFSRALTRFELTDDELAAIVAPVLLISFESDWLYPPADSTALEAALAHAEHVTLSSPYGHDSFLLDCEAQAPFIRRFLDTIREERQ